MKRSSVFVLCLLLFGAFCEWRAYTFSDCIGIYESENHLYYDVDSNISAYHLRIELHADSTFWEIQDNYQCINLADFWGNWKVKGDSIELNRLGTLDRIQGSYVAGDTSFLIEAYRHSKATLFIESQSSLVLVEKGIQAGLRLRKK